MSLRDIEVGICRYRHLALVEAFYFHFFRDPEAHDLVQDLEKDIGDHEYVNKVSQCADTLCDKLGTATVEQSLYRAGHTVQPIPVGAVG